MRIPCLCFAVLMGGLLNAQPSLQSVEGLPTKELYDLHVDKKGYLWIAHDLGLSRFDGLNFIHYSNPNQAALGMSDITEDQQGRIWCHNFSGQIFYAENGQLKWLQAYQFDKEAQFPRIALCGDELLATSDKGLFICSTSSLQSRYLTFPSLPGKGLLSIAVAGNTAILSDNTNWYTYQKGVGVQSLKVDTAIHFIKGNSISLQPATIGNTLFAAANPSGIVYKMVLRGHRLQLAAKLEINDFINSVSVSGQTWIHSRNWSKSMDNKWVIQGKSLTDVVQDKEGNTWFSSLKQGLMVAYKRRLYTLIKPPVDSDDFVRCLNGADGYFLAGTNRGNLMVLDSSLTQAEWEMRLLDGYGSIDFIRFYRNHRFVAGTSINTYIVNPVEKKVEDLLPLSTVKDVDFDANSLYLATSNGLYIMPWLDSLTIDEWLAQKKRQFPFMKSPPVPEDPWLFVVKRSRAIRYDKSEETLFVSFKDGLYQVNQKGQQVFRIGGKDVFASSLWYQHPRLFIATFSDGLWIKTGSRLRHITTADFLTSNTILRIKVTRNHLWLFLNQGIQVLDIATEKILQEVDLPAINGANVFDVAERDNYAYLTTAEGVYKVPLQNASEEKIPSGFLDAVIVNNLDTLRGKEMTLPYNRNDLQFLFSSPSFYDPRDVSFKYRLVGADHDWQVTRPGERLLRYAALNPGDYTFEAYAFTKKGLVQPERILYKLHIQKPWWKQAWFVSFCLLLLASLIYFLYQYRLRELLKVESIRRRISGDLHDDIGATLSTLNIYSSLARKEKGNEKYLQLIQQHATEVVNKLDDLVWSINPRNDTSGQLLNRMKNFAEPVLEAAGFTPHFHYNQQILQVKLDPFTKHHIYLLFKEMVHNVVKHADGTHCYMEVDRTENTIILTVKDDGVGFDVLEPARAGNGIPNMKQRASKIKGDLQINSSPMLGSIVTVRVPI